MRGKPNPSEWKQLNTEDPYAAGLAFQRFTWLMDYDPYMRMLDSNTRSELANLIFSERVLGNGKILVTSMQGISEHVMHALNLSPLARLLTEEFKHEIIFLVKTAVLAGKEQ